MSNAAAVDVRYTNFFAILCKTTILRCVENMNHEG